MNMLAPIDWPNKAAAIAEASMKCVVATGIGLDGALEALGRQREIGVTGELARQELGRVDDHLVAPVRCGENPGPGHDDVAAKHEIGAARGDADGVDLSEFSAMRM